VLYKLFLKKINFFYIFKLFLCINTKINLFFLILKAYLQVTINFWEKRAVLRIMRWRRPLSLFPLLIEPKPLYHYVLFAFKRPNKPVLYHVIPCILTEQGSLRTFLYPKHRNTQWFLEEDKGR
jgi:hypothetical protein